MRDRENQILLREGFGGAGRGLAPYRSGRAPQATPGPGKTGAPVLGLTWWLMLVLGLPMLFAHLVTVALTKALQSYSRSRLEEYLY